MSSSNDALGNSGTGVHARRKEASLLSSGMLLDTKYGSVAQLHHEEQARSDLQSTTTPQLKTHLSFQDDDELDDGEITYVELLRKNRPFRLFLWSYVANHAGEWLTYIASISAIEQIQRNSGIMTTSRAAISTLIVVRLTPIIVLSPFGGVLADGRDRRQSMIALDLAGAAVAWLFILATQLQSIPMIYLATFLQECVTGLYEPSRSAIIPLLVPEGEGLKQATTLTVLAWSLIAAFGAASGGLLVSVFGVKYCYFADSLTYLLSAFLMMKVGGTWNVSSNEPHESPWETIKGMVTQGLLYVRTSFFGTLILIKFSGALMYGGIDVLNVSFSERGGAEGSSARLGIMFAAMGVGCLMGPFVSAPFTDLNKPKSLQLSCIYAFGISIFGLLMMSIFRPFWLLCVFSGIRAMGSTIAWTNSSLLIQKFTAPEMLGRVTALEYALALFGEGASAVAAGLLQDYGFDTEEVTLMLAIGGTVLMFLWAYYHYTGGGAASYKEESNKVVGTTAHEKASLLASVP